MADYHALADTFFFDSFAYEGGKAVFRYSTDAGHSFTHALTCDFPHVDAAQLAPALFALGMAELAHFWKATLAPKIVVKAGALSPEQVVFWENLYTKGLGEFFYVNKIDFRGLVYIESAPEAPEILPSKSVLEPRALVPLGGGKDSLVTAELLKQHGKTFSWFELVALPFGPKLRELSENTACVAVQRDNAKSFAPVVELVKQGAPNGHVPITATYMLAAVLAAKAHGFSDVVMSLERSAEEGNVEYLGMSVNHQYSKSLEFERMVGDYVARYVDPDIRIFSLLRSLYELQIVREFAQYPQYFDHFVSCNRGLQTSSWCGACAKCAFMFAALSAFLPPQTVVAIFKKNLFADESLLPLYEELIGMHESKPFECVGTYDENRLALYLSGEKYKEAGMPLPPILTKLPIEKGAAHLALLDERGPERVPSDYQKP